jgi:hypothetical protein
MKIQGYSRNSRLFYSFDVEDLNSKFKYEALKREVYLPYALDKVNEFLIALNMTHNYPIMINKNNSMFLDQISEFELAINKYAISGITNNIYETETGDLVVEFYMVSGGGFSYCIKIIKTKKYPYDYLVSITDMLSDKALVDNKVFFNLHSVNRYSVITTLKEILYKNIFKRKCFDDVVEEILLWHNFAAEQSQNAFNLQTVFECENLYDKNNVVMIRAMEYTDIYEIEFSTSVGLAGFKEGEWGFFYKKISLKTSLSDYEACEVSRYVELNEIIEKLNIEIFENAVSGNLIKIGFGGYAVNKTTKLVKFTLSNGGKVYARSLV